VADLWVPASAVNTADVWAPASSVIAKSDTDTSTATESISSTASKSVTDTSSGTDTSRTGPLASDTGTGADLDAADDTLGTALGRYKLYDFETGTVQGLTTSGTGTSVDTAHPHSGTYSLKHIKTTPTTAGYNYKDFGFTFPGKATVTAWIYFVTFPQVSTPILYGANSGSSVNSGVLRFQTSTGKLYLTDGVGVQLGSLSNALSLNTWYRVDLVFEPNAGPTGRLSVYLDGTLFAQGKGNATVFLGRVYIGVTSPNVTYELYFDDVSINTAIPLIATPPAGSETPTATETASTSLVIPVEIFSTDTATGTDLSAADDTLGTALSRYKLYDFNDGTLQGLTSGAGTSISTTHPHSGTYSVKHLKTAPGAVIQSYKFFGFDYPGRVSATFWVYFVTFPEGEETGLCYMRNNVNSVGVGRIRLAADNTLILQDGTPTIGVPIGSPSVPLQLNTWHRVDFVADPLAGSTGMLEGYLDGILFAHGSSTQQSGLVGFFGVGMLGTNPTYEVYFDDISINVPVPLTAIPPADSDTGISTDTEQLGVNTFDTDFALLTEDENLFASIQVTDIGSLNEYENSLATIGEFDTGNANEYESLAAATHDSDNSVGTDVDVVMGTYASELVLSIEDASSFAIVMDDDTVDFNEYENLLAELYDSDVSSSAEFGYRSGNRPTGRSALTGMGHSELAGAGHKAGNSQIEGVDGG
jgi:hypothetical protein